MIPPLSHGSGTLEGAEQCAGNDTADYKADTGFDQSLNADKSSNKEDRITYAEAGSDSLNIFGVIKKDTQKSHKKQGV